MRFVRQSPDELVLQDEPGRFWAFGSFFVVIGLMAIVASAGPGRSLGFWPSVAGVVMGCVGIGAGVWFVGRSPLSTIVVRPNAAELSVDRRGLFGRKRLRFDLGPFLQARLGRGTDMDGDPVYRLVADFQEVGEVSLSVLWQHETRGLELAVQAINQYARVGPRATA